MKLHKRYLGCMNWPGANQMRSFEIPRNYALVGLEFELVADLTRASTAGDGGGPKDCAPAQLIASLDLIANGSDTIKHTDFETLTARTNCNSTRGPGFMPRTGTATPTRPTKS